MKLIQWFKVFIILILILWSATLLYFWHSSNSSDIVINPSVENLRNQINILEQQFLNIMDLSNDVRNMKKLSIISDPLIQINNKSNFIGISRDPIEEMLRRRTHSNLIELLNTILDRGNYKQSNINDFIKDLQHRLLSIISDVELISETKFTQNWRKNELLRLGELIQRRIIKLQNPKNCIKARKITCNLNKGCGYGCQIHHVLYCMILAYSTQRTLLLDSRNWRYGSGIWNSVFQPLSQNCVYSQVTMTSVNWGDPNMEKANNILVPIIDTLFSKPNYLPQAIPSDIIYKLSLLHSDPFAWFAGQLLSYVVRPNNEIEKVLKSYNNDQYSKLSSMGPIVGVHIRRTDKVGTEAQFHSLNEYMNHVERYFQKEEIKLNLKLQLEDLVRNSNIFKHKTIKVKRQVVIATDEPLIFEEMKSQYPQYYVIGNRQNSQTAGVNNRYSNDALKAIIIDTMFLSRTSFLVCTFSSQVCRVAYELMQTNVLKSADGDQGNRFRSLDDIYYFGGQHSNRVVIIQEHKSANVDLKVGDTLNIMGNHWNGWSKGSSTTNRDCLFPTYKAQFLRISEEMGFYNETDEV